MKCLVSDAKALYPSALYCKCNAVPGERPSKFTTPEKPNIHYVMQMLHLC